MSPSSSSLASTQTDLEHLKQAYPETICSVDQNHIYWANGDSMIVDAQPSNRLPEEILNTPLLLDQIRKIHYQPGIPTDPEHYTPKDDPGRIRYEPFFRKMYGETESEVETHLTTIFWMPNVFGTVYPLKVTKINGIDQKFIQISNDLEQLVQSHPDYIPYLEHPSETFNWRVIANTNRISPHSFGMTIDLKEDISDYWQWDLSKANLPISEFRSKPLIYRNQIPWEIIPVFEAQGFIWGGKWAHYDTQHFEYRPELF